MVFTPLKNDKKENFKFNHFLEVKVKYTVVLFVAKQFYSSQLTGMVSERFEMTGWL